MVRAIEDRVVDLQFWGTVYVTFVGIFIAACMWYIMRP